jgi:type 1 fimbria pilin
MRAVILLLLMAATAACGAYHFPGASPSGTGTVSGHVVAVPCTPIEAANQSPCAGRLLAGLEIDFTGNGTALSTRTDSSGAYSVELAAGTWKVSFKSFMRIISGPPTVTVQAGSSVVADYVVDSRIRVPVSKEPSTNPHPPEGVPAA